MKELPEGSSESQLQLYSRIESITEAVRELEDRYRASGRITAVRQMPAREGEFAEIPRTLHDGLREALLRSGIDQLYVHQAMAAEAAQAGKNVVVVTPTASGKTLCYNLPVIDKILRKPSARAFYLFPTKALAQDQLAEMKRLSNYLPTPLKTYTYDGDTPSDARKAIRSESHIAFTNPDMLHAGILPCHTKWARFLENLEFVVIDELHTYRGVFGSHLCNVLRRLKRICAFYGSSPRFLCSSATIGNPRELAMAITESDVELIDRNGSPAAEKYFVFYNPPVVDRELGIRRSYLQEARSLAARLIKNGFQTIIFAGSRLHTEVLLSYLKQDLEKSVLDADSVRGYRGGYLPKRRREIEEGLRSGEIRGVVSTNALELGIDVGHLDVSIMAGYPGTISSTWQQAGRSGRRNAPSLAVLVASSSPLDQFIVNHPSYFFSQNPEMGLINPDNLSIFLDHLKCAAFELPIGAHERFGKRDLKEILAMLVDRGFLHLSQEKYFWVQEAYPADAVSLRSISSDNFVVVDQTGKPEIIAEVDFGAALTTLHEKAIYLLESQRYIVEKMDYDQRKAYVKKTEVDYFTDAISYRDVKVLEEFHGDDMHGGRSSHGEVHVARQVVGFKKIKFNTMENVGYGNLQLPQNDLQTTSYWLRINEKLIDSIEGSPDERVLAVWGLAFLLHHLAPLYLMCDVRDLQEAVCDDRTKVPLQQPGPRREPPPRNFEPVVFIYDNYPGGIGLSEPLHRLSARLLAEAQEVLNQCQCASGCPSCIGPNINPGRSLKRMVEEILRGLVDAKP